MKLKELFIEWLTESRYIQHLEAELKERLEEKNAQIRQLQVDLAIERRRKQHKALDRETAAPKPYEWNNFTLPNDATKDWASDLNKMLQEEEDATIGQRSSDNEGSPPAFLGGI